MADVSSGSDCAPPSEPSLETTASLLARARLGDQAARNQLAARYYPLLQRWAHGRLPPGARCLMDTGDLVQESLLRALDHLKGFEPKHEGAFMAYLRQIVMNRIRDEIRSARRMPGQATLTESLQGMEPSPLESTIGREAFGRYEAALQTLTSGQREAIVLRVEMGYSYQQVADAMFLPSANAARMLVARALVRLSELLP